MPAAALPTALSPDYVPKSDPEEDPEEDDYEDPKEDPANYPTDGGDEGDDEDELLEDDEDDDVDIEADDEEEEEKHPAPVDSAVVALLAVDQAPSAEETEPFETDESATTSSPHPAYRVTARISIPAPIPSPLLPPIPSPLLPLSPPLPVSSTPTASPIRLLGYQAVMIRLRAEAPSTSHSLLLPSTYHLTPPSGTPSPLPIPAPTSSPPLLLPSTSRREDMPKVCLPPQKRLCFAFGPRYEVRESSSVAAARPTRGLRIDYGFVATMDREIRRDPERDAMINQGVTATLVARDTNRNGNDSHTSGTGTEGVSGLSQWFERMDSVFHISNCIVKNQVKFATCTLYSVALTWSTANANNANNQRGTGSGQRPTLRVWSSGTLKEGMSQAEEQQQPGLRSNQGHEARLHIILYTKTQEYMLKGRRVFLANITTKETEDKSKEKRLEDVPIVQDFPDVFPKDLPGLPPTRQVEFQIDLIPGAAPVA
ncbi:hypothetical protein Tco_0676254 [Tanacetum coccineum]